MQPRTGLSGSLVLSVSLVIAACAPQDAPPPGESTDDDDPLVPVVALPDDAEAMSLLGEPLFPPARSEEVAARQDAQLAEAIETLETDRFDPEALIWVGRRYAYTGQYRTAIEAFTHGVDEFPEDARFLRHRGHRYISVREFERAERDFARAVEIIEGTEDEVEPDGQPNALGIPTSTLHFNIWYHYGLALFLQGDFEAAIPVYRACMDASVHPDSKAATAHWLYMALRRAGQRDEARGFIQGLDLDAWEPEIIESGSYFALLALYQDAEAAGGEPR